MNISRMLFRAWIGFAVIWLGMGLLVLAADWWYHGFAATFFGDLFVLLAVPASLLIVLWLTAGLASWIVRKLRHWRDLIG